MRCSYCGSQLHTTKHCPKTWGGQGNRAGLRCSYCGGRDHNERACPKLGHGAPDPDDFILDREPWSRPR
jgi:hypothetical protein